MWTVTSPSCKSLHIILVSLWQGHNHTEANFQIIFFKMFSHYYNLYRIIKASTPTSLPALILTKRFPSYSGKAG